MLEKSSLMRGRQRTAIQGYRSPGETKRLIRIVARRARNVADGIRLLVEHDRAIATPRFGRAQGTGLMNLAARIFPM